MTKMYYQCRLRNGDAETVGWIEERGAKIGASVELIEDNKNLWTVIAVHMPGIDGEILTKNQRLNRGSLASIKS